MIIIAKDVHSYVILIIYFCIKMYRSAEKSGFLDNMTFIQNGVDQERRTAQMSIDGGNNGGSFVKLGGDEEEIINKRKINMKFTKKNYKY